MDLLGMTHVLIRAQIEQRHITAGTLDTWIRRTHATLLDLLQQELGAPTAQVPTTPPRANWRYSVQQKRITCLECSQAFRQLGARHLVSHGLTPATYRKKYGIPADQALAAKELTARRREVMRSGRIWEQRRGKKGRKNG